MKYKLSEIAEIVTGGTPSTKNSAYWNGKIPWITPKDLSTYKKRYISQGERNITEQGLNNSSAVMLPKNSILFTSRAPIGYIAISENEVCTNQGFKSLVCDDSKCYFLYLYYWLLNNIDYIKSQANGSTFQEISGSVMKKIEIDLPNINIQKKIVKVLDCIDKKIELNNQINDNLQNYCENYYKNFINKIKDYNEVDIGSICDLLAGGDKPKDISINKTNINNIPIYSNGITKQGIYGYTNVSKIDKKAVTVSARGTIGYTCLRLEPYYPIIRLISIIPKDNTVSAEYVYLSVLNMNIISTGTTQQQLTVPDFKKYKIIVPTKRNDLIVFQNVVEPIYREIFKNNKQNETLERLRDTLLPKLMNGEINLEKIEI